MDPLEKAPEKLAPAALSLHLETEGDLVLDASLTFLMYSTVG